jgi:hypothetical protein
MPYFIGFVPGTYPLLFVSTKLMALSKASSFDVCDARTEENTSEAVFAELEEGVMTPR